MQPMIDRFVLFMEHPYVREVVDFVVIFGGVVVLGVFVLNYKMFWNEFQFRFGETDL